MSTAKYAHLATSIFVFAFVGSSSATAQLGPLERQGFAGALAHGHFLNDTPSAAEPPVTIKAPGPQPTGPVDWSRILFPNGPDYTSQVMFPGLSTVVKIDGHSSGNDDIPVFIFDSSTGYWTPDLGLARWMQITASVTNEAVGIDESLIYRRTQLAPPDRTTPGSDLIGYYFANSVDIDESLLGATLLEQSSEGMGYFGDQDISALDWGVGVLSTASAAAFPELLFTNEDEYYFTVTRNSAAAINALIGSGSSIQFAASGSTQVQACGATIYLTEWSGSDWSQPQVYRSADQLGLDPEVDELDAIAVNPFSGTTIFSTQYQPGFSQLQVHNAGWVVSEPLWDDGDFVAKKIGSTDDSDDIDSVAIIDPGTESTSNYATHLATPVPNYLLAYGAAKTMGLSVTRGRAPLDNSAQDDFYAQVSGWGSATPKKGFVYLYVAFNFDPAKPEGTNWFYCARVPRAAGDDAVDFELKLPNDVASSSGQLIAFTAVLTDQASMPCSLSMVGVMAGL